MTEKYIKINDFQIPTNIKSYKNSKSVKIYFKGNVLNITKPTRMSQKRLMEILENEKEVLYDKYQKIKSSEIKSIKQWKTGEKIFYKGQEFSIVREYINTLHIQIKIDEDNKNVTISVPGNVNENVIKEYVDKAIKRIFKKNTEILISKKLPYWCEITGFNYNECKIRDAITRYGSCMPSKKNLYFSSRLIMLPEDKVDGIIVHELCHMKYKYHNEDFYNFVKKFIPNYEEIDMWLKKYGEIIMF